MIRFVPCLPKARHIFINFSNKVFDYKSTLSQFSALRIFLWCVGSFRDGIMRTLLMSKKFIGIIKYVGFLAFGQCFLW